MHSFSHNVMWILHWQRISAPFQGLVTGGCQANLAALVRRPHVPDGKCIVSWGLWARERAGAPLMKRAGAWDHCFHFNREFGNRHPNLLSCQPSRSSWLLQGGPQRSLPAPRELWGGQTEREAQADPTGERSPVARAPTFSTCWRGAPPTSPQVVLMVAAGVAHISACSPPAVIPGRLPWQTLWKWFSMSPPAATGR